MKCDKCKQDTEFYIHVKTVRFPIAIYNWCPSCVVLEGELQKAWRIEGYN